MGEPGFRLPSSVDRLAERALGRRRIEFHELDPWHLKRDLALCWELYNAAWADNLGFVPVSYEEWLYMTKDGWLVVRSDCSFIATVDGVPAAFALAFPDYNEALYANRGGNAIPVGIARMLWHKSRARHFRTMALGVAPAFRSRGVLALFMRECVRRAKVVGCVGLEGSWLLEDNIHIVQPMRAMGARDRMRWRLYERPIVAV